MRFPPSIGPLLLAAALLGGCASAKDPRDPFEPVNRAIYRMNEGVDATIVEPAAKLYRFILPQPVRTGVGNVVSNTFEVRNILNNSLQGKFANAYASFGRLAMNSTLGVLGLFDIASEAGIEKYEEDLGQTFGRWGIGNGPFIVLPLFGPSTVRDAVGWIGDIYVDPFTYVEPVRTRNQIWAGWIVHRRAELLDLKKVLESAALDEYQFVRDAYLQRRRNLVYDGKPPPEKDAIVAPPKPEGDKPK